MKTQVKSVTDVIEYLKKIPIEENPYILHPKYYYRGHSDTKYLLTPSIKRDGFSIALERRLIELARNKLPSVFRDTDKLSLLAKMQHYGLPTRLIDVTLNPLVALYFACQNEETDGEILIFENYMDISGKVRSFSTELIKIRDTTDPNDRFEQLRCYDSTFVKELILNLIEIVPRNGIFVEDLRKQIVNYTWFQDWEKKFFYEFHNLNEQYQIIANLLRSPIFVETQETLERQRFQQGLFMLTPNRVSVNEQGKYIILQEIPYLDVENSNIGHIIIKADDKKSILKELNLIGINEGFLFGDNIDCICRQIRRSLYEFYDNT